MQNLKKSSQVCSTHFGPYQLLIKWGLKQRASVYQNFVVLVFSSSSKTDLKIRPPHSVNLISSKFQILVNGINFSNYVEVLYICFFMIIDQIITIIVTVHSFSPLQGLFPYSFIFYLLNNIVLKIITTVGIWITDLTSIQVMNICQIVEWSVIQMLFWIGNKNVSYSDHGLNNRKLSGIWKVDK